LEKESRRIKVKTHVHPTARKHLAQSMFQGDEELLPVQKYALNK
jgi:hypothetical protein